MKRTITPEQQHVLNMFAADRGRIIYRVAVPVFFALALLFVYGLFRLFTGSVDGGLLTYGSIICAVSVFVYPLFVWLRPISGFIPYAFALTIMAFQGVIRLDLLRREFSVVTLVAALVWFAVGFFLLRQFRAITKVVAVGDAAREHLIEEMKKGEERRMKGLGDDKR
jgi:hypothetical protein